MKGSPGRTDAAALHRSGVMAIQRGQLAEGRAMLEAAAAGQPESVRYLADLAQVQLMTGDESAAVKTYQRCLKIDPGLIPAWLNLGILMLQAERIEEAGDCFQRAVDADPKLVDAHSGLGVARQRQNRLAEAVEAFEQAASLAPRDAEIRANLGGALQEVGESERAIACFQQAIRLAPERASIHTMLGALLHEVQGAQAALSHYDEALRLVPGDAHTLAVKGSALAALGRREEAARIFDHDALIATKQITAAPGYSDMPAFNRALADHAIGHPTLMAEPFGKTTRGGGQTEQLLGPKTGPIAVLEGLIRSAIDDYFADRTRAQHPYCPRRSAPGRLYAWATVLDSGGYQDPHNHPSGVLSGVYYVQLPDTGEAGAIEFGRPPRQFSSSLAPDVVLIRPQAGLLVLFPSFFWHRTIPFRGDGKRISIAFDLIVGR
ncbi:MAG: tetratricopeptide repeat protein [Paracoccaceae bacterium]